MSWLDEIEALRSPVSPELLRVAMPRCQDANEWADELSDALIGIRLTNAGDVAMFLAQVGHESADLNRLEESLWYSADRLRAVWPHRFPTLEDARRYSGNPERLANEVYADRLGNTQPGDGWLFRGRGPIQLTGRANYSACADDTGLPLVEHPERLSTIPRYGAIAAAWYWDRRVTRGADIETVTKAVNGGLHGLSDRRERYKRIMAEAGKAR